MIAPVPTLVYRHAQHLISLTEIPAGSCSEVTRTPGTINGYNVVHWTENCVSYWAIFSADQCNVFRA